MNNHHMLSPYPKRNSLHQTGAHDVKADSNPSFKGSFEAGSEADASFDINFDVNFDVNFDINTEANLDTDDSSHAHAVTIPHLRERIYQQLYALQHSKGDVANVDVNLRHEVLDKLTWRLPLSNTWWLLGTQGCHLCDAAEETLRLFCRVVPIAYETIDIIHLSEALMLNVAPLIPVILTPTKQINYPFSVIELHHLF